MTTAEMTIPEMIEQAREAGVVFCVTPDPRPLKQIGTYQGIPIFGHDSEAE